MTTIEVDGGFLRLEGTEGDLARIIAQRQRLGLKKYGVSLRNNQLNFRAWMVHDLEEMIDSCLYKMRQIEEWDKMQDDMK